MKVSRTFTILALAGACTLPMHGSARAEGPPVAQEVATAEPSELPRAAEPSDSHATKPIPAVEPSSAPVEHDAQEVVASAGEDFLLVENAIYVAVPGSVRIFPRAGGKSKTLASGISAPAGLATDGTSVYVAARGTESRRYLDGSIVVVPKRGKSVRLAYNLPGPKYVVVDDERVFWLTEDYSGKGTVASCTKDKCKPEILVSGLAKSSYLLADGTHLYWATKGQILSMPKAGGSPTALAEVKDRTGGVVYGLAVDETYLYFAGPGGIQRVAKGGGRVQDVARDAQSAGQIAVDTENVYWVQDGTDRVFKATKTGGPAIGLSPPSFEGTTSVDAIRVDATHVYFTLYQEMGNSESTAIYRVQK